MITEPAGIFPGLFGLMSWDPVELSARTISGFYGGGGALPYCQQTDYFGYFPSPLQYLTFGQYLFTQKMHSMHQLPLLGPSDERV